MSNDSPSAKSTARWLPFQCPSCFGLFRAKRDEAGEIGRCPGCSSKLLIPTPEGQATREKEKETTDQNIDQKTALKNYSKAEIIEPSEESAAVNGDWSEDQSRRRRRFAGDQAERLDWEESDLPMEKAQVSWLLIISMMMLGALLIVGGMKLLERSSNGVAPTNDVFLAQADIMLNENNKREQGMSAGAEEEVDETRKMIESFERFDSSKIRESLKAFLTASSIEEKLKYSRATENLEEKMERFYAGDAPTTQGFQSLDHTQTVYRGDFISTSIRLTDFLDYAVVIERVDEDDYRIDWESWVGYSDRKVGEMLALKPTQPIQVRAYVSTESYYNYLFSDDQKWRSMRLAFRNEDRALWAYIELGSDVERDFKKLASGFTERPMMLLIKYPPNGRANDQVIIEKVVDDGWVSFPKE